MASTYKTPGVYVEEIAKFPPSVAPVETAIPAFIGYTEKAQTTVAGDLNLKPTRISSMAEYTAYFGAPQKETNIAVTVTTTTDATTGATSEKVTAALPENKRSKHILSYAMQLYFANGGGPCYIVSVGGYKTLGTALVETELHKGLDAIAKEDEPTLLVIPEAQSLGINDFNTLMGAALQQCTSLQDRFTILDVNGDTVSMADPAAKLKDWTDAFRSHGIATNTVDALKYGAAYAPNVETTIDFAYDEGATSVTGATAVPAPAPPTPAPAPAPATLDKLNLLQTARNDLYTAAQAAIRDLACTLPPSSAVAGVYAAIDASRGVWKAPANVSLAAVVQPTIQFTNADQDLLNVDSTGGKSINAIRAFTGQGTLVWGARTLAGNDNEWRYINVRRLFIFVEESVKKATMQFVFEPNDANSWVKVQGMIENFLTTLWRQGALQGVKPEHAFYVSVGLGKTMTALDILEGRMIVEIGMAAVRPAEFIVLRFSHKMAES